MKTKHGERKHAKFSASGSERWMTCSGSVALSEGIPSKESEASLEGTLCHEVTEHETKVILGGPGTLTPGELGLISYEMRAHAKESARTIVAANKELGGDLFIETKADLSFIHDDMFGTLDYSMVSYFDTLYILDLKYGRYPVSPGTPKAPNTQLAFYAVGEAERFHWNFKKVRLGVLQPRLPRFDGPVFCEMGIEDLRLQVDVFKRAVERVERFPKKYVEGKWCFFCPAKPICPLHTDKKAATVQNAFAARKVK